MIPSFTKFNQYKLITPELCDGYCTHTISGESAFGARPGTEKWVRCRALGQGGFATVWLEREEQGALRAVKQISKSHISMAPKELLAFSTLKAYPELFVQFFGWFEDDRDIYIAMEYVESGDLASLICRKNMVEDDAKTITRQLLEGVKVMHKNDFCHRDLKPMNILVASLSPIVVKIADFGITKKIDDSTVLRTAAGTPGYTAPEVLGYLPSETSVYTNAVDIWSLGCITHAIITKESPFIEPRRLFDYIESRIVFPTTKLMENGASLTAISFISSLMTVQPEKRLVADEALGHSWFSNNTRNEEEDTIWTMVSDRARKERNIILHDCVTLYCAVNHGNLDVVKRLCSGVNVNARQRGNTTLLHMSVSSGVEGIMRLLLDAGADISAKDGNGRTALDLVLIEGHEGMAKLLLAAGAKIPTYISGDTALHTAIIHGHTHEGIVKLLLENGLGMEEKNRHGHTALQLAASHGLEGMVRLLLEYGAKAEQEDGSGATALHIAADEGQESVLELLLKRGLGLVQTQRPAWLTLHVAVSLKHEGVVKLLLKYGFDVDMIDDNGRTPLQDARGESMVKLLLEHGADIEHQCWAGCTALFLAVMGRNLEVARVLLENGADTEKKERNGRTALHLAVKNANISMITLLLKHGAAVTEKDRQGHTPLYLATALGLDTVVKLVLPFVVDLEDKNVALYLAVQDGYEKIVSLLLGHGAQLDARGPSRNTILHLAADAGRASMVALLLRHGASVDATNISQNTALHKAAYRGHPGMVELLLKAGANAEKPGWNGTTPIQLAAQMGYVDVVMLLVKAGADVENTGMALRAAAEHGRAGVVRVLLKHGSCVGDSKGLALEVARKWGRTEVVKVLLLSQAEL